MITEDDLGKALNAGTMTVDQVLAALDGQDDDVYVYPAMGLTEGTETWEQVEELGAGSTLFAELNAAGASDEQMDQAGASVEALRAAGRTLDKVFGWGPGEAPVPGEMTTQDEPIEPVVADDAG